MKQLVTLSANEKIYKVWLDDAEQRRFANIQARNQPRSMELNDIATYISDVQETRRPESQIIELASSEHPELATVIRELDENTDLTALLVARLGYAEAYMIIIEQVVLTVTAAKALTLSSSTQDDL